MNTNDLLAIALGGQYSIEERIEAMLNIKDDNLTAELAQSPASCIDSLVRLIQVKGNVHLRYLAFENLTLNHRNHLLTQATINEVARNDASEALRFHALQYVDDQALLEWIVFHDNDIYCRKRALERLDSPLITERLILEVCEDEPDWVNNLRIEILSHMKDEKIIRSILSKCKYKEHHEKLLERLLKLALLS